MELTDDVGSDGAVRQLPRDRSRWATIEAGDRDQPSGSLLLRGTVSRRQAAAAGTATAAGTGAAARKPEQLTLAGSSDSSYTLPPTAMLRPGSGRREKRL